MPHWLKATHNHQSCISDALKLAEQVCLEHGQRFTQLRREVLAIIWQAHKPIGAYAVLEQLSHNKRKAAPPTVYRALDFLLELGLIHRINSLNAYTGCLDPKAAHQGQFLICRQCGEALELQQPAILNQIAKSAADRGFRAEQTMIEVLGLCPGCAKIL